MFARVITARVSAEQVAQLEQVARDQLPGAQARPGYRGYSMLWSETSSSALIVSLWDTREEMDAVSAGTADGIHDGGLSPEDLERLHLETFTVLLHDRQDRE